jgi:hypothetical protein
VVSASGAARTRDFTRNAVALLESPAAPSSTWIVPTRVEALAGVERLGHRSAIHQFAASFALCPTIPHNSS